MFRHSPQAVTEHARVIALVRRRRSLGQDPDQPPTGAVIGLPKDPRYEDPKARRDAHLKPGRELGLTVLDDAIRASLKRGAARRGEPLRFESDGEAWWSGTTSFPLDPAMPLLTAVLVPERDLLGAYSLMRLWVISGAALALALATALSRRAEKPVHALIAQTDRFRKGDFSPGAPIETRMLEIRNLAGAVVSAQQGGVEILSARILPDGSYRLGPLQLGTYDLVVTATGHAPSTKTGVVAGGPGSFTLDDVTLDAVGSGRVQGLVTGGGFGTAVRLKSGGALITFTGIDPVTGAYALAGVPAGTYEVELWGPLGPPIPLPPIVVTAGGTVTVP